MSHNDAGLERGQTTTLLPAPGVLGIIKEWEDRDFSVTGYIKPLLSGRWTKALLAQNVSGGALTPGQQVKLDYSNANGLIKISGACTTDDISDGNIDEYLPSAGVADQSYCWVIVEGPTKFKNQLSSTITAGNTVSTGTTGRVVKNTLGNNSPQSCGRCLTTDATADDLFRCERFARSPATSAFYALNGIASGYKVARGVSAVTNAGSGIATVVTGLTTVVAVVATMVDDPTTTCEVVTASIGDQAGAPAAGSVYLKGWKTLGGTPVAMTTTSVTVNWVAVGT